MRNISTRKYPQNPVKGLIRGTILADQGTVRACVSISIIHFVHTQHCSCDVMLNRSRRSNLGAVRLSRSYQPGGRRWGGTAAACRSSVHTLPYCHVRNLGRFRADVKGWKYLVHEFWPLALESYRVRLDAASIVPLKNFQERVLIQESPHTLSLARRRTSGVGAWGGASTIHTNPSSLFSSS